MNTQSRLEQLKFMHKNTKLNKQLRFNFLMFTNNFEFYLIKLLKDNSKQFVTDSLLFF